MDGLPSRELLEAMHTFPGSFMFKAIGMADNHFVGRVIAVVKLELAVDAEPQFSTRLSANGNHVSVTIEPHLDSVDQVLAIYGRLRTLEGLKMLM